jgi:hypothetical protein
MVWRIPVRMSDLVEQPPELVDSDGHRYERYDFSNEYVGATVTRTVGDDVWELDVQTNGYPATRYSQQAVAEAIKLAAEVAAILNKPTKSVAADEALSNEMRVLLADREWTFREAAAAFGIELGRFGNLVCGQTRWTVTDMWRIAEAISDDPDEEFARLASITRAAIDS